ncbi:MAG: thrombospondin type 3 repeat-containing protein [Verrucomicrobia bacterium]|nr:thrombospondin type 3 repeat-containing protein [Verrucomicrobiota bacterium]
MSAKTTGITDLETRFRDEQDALIPVIPPSEDFILRQPLSGCIVPFDVSDFPKEFIGGLIGEYENSVTVYPVTIAEDPETRATLFLNSTDTVIYSLPAEKSYNPYAFLFDLYPLINTGIYAQWWVSLQYALWDPSRIQITMTLIEDDNVEPYLYVEHAVAQSAALSAASLGGGSMMMSMHSSNELWLGINGPVQGVTTDVEVVAHIPDGFTNHIEFYTCENILNFWWDLGATNLATEGTNLVAWTDADADSQVRRHYAAGNADINATTDPDDDGLVWGREWFMYHTNPTNSDTDADGYSDYEEVITYKTDPNNDDTNTPTATISVPTNGTRRVWLP